MFCTQEIIAHTHCEPTLAITITKTTSTRGEIDARDRDRDREKNELRKICYAHQNVIIFLGCSNAACSVGLEHITHTLSLAREAVSGRCFALPLHVMCVFTHIGDPSFVFYFFFAFLFLFRLFRRSSRTTTRRKRKKEENKNFTRKNMWLKFSFIVDTYWTNVHTTSPSTSPPSSTSEVFSIIFLFLKSAECESIASNAMKMTEPRPRLLMEIRWITKNSHMRKK